MSPEFFYHGGVDGLRPGDILEGGQSRKHHDGCLWCEARRDGEAHLGLDGPSQNRAVYFTRERLYAKFHASMYGLGDLYRVEPLGALTASEEDSIPSFHSPTARVISVYDRAVLLTFTERRRLDRIWTAADELHINRKARP